jgi:hypothetical protein
MPNLIPNLGTAPLQDALTDLFKRKDKAPPGEPQFIPLVFWSDWRAANFRSTRSTSSNIRGVDKILLEVMPPDKQGFDLDKPEVEMKVNPSSIEFAQGKRFVKQDTMRGSVFHHFTNSKGQNNDILTIKLSGSTGNLAMRGTEAENALAMERHRVWANLYSLTREPVLVNGVRNRFHVRLQTLLFSAPVTFTGFFSQVLSFSEHGNKPNSRDYSLEFTVEETDPDLNSLITYIYPSPAR